MEAVSISLLKTQEIKPLFEVPDVVSELRTSAEHLTTTCQMIKGEEQVDPGPAPLTVELPASAARRAA